MKKHLGVAVLMAILASAALGMCGRGLLARPSEPETDGADSGPVVGPMREMLEQLVPHARGVFLAEVEAIERHDGRNTDGPLTQVMRLRVLDRTGVGLDEITWLLTDGNMPFGRQSYLFKRETSPARKLKVRPEDFIVGRRYWFATAPEAEGDFYPQGIISYWPADTAGVPNAIPKALQSDAYRWQPDLRFPDLGLSIGWQADLVDSIVSVRIWEDRALLWEQRVSGAPGDLALNRAYAFYTSKPKSVEADSVVLVFVGTHERLRPGNEYGVRAGVWSIATIYRGYTGRRLASGISVDSPGGYENDRVWREYDPTTGRISFERILDRISDGGERVGLPSRAWYRRVERWIEPETGAVLRERVLGNAGGAGAAGEWREIDHDQGLAAEPVGYTSRE